MVPYLHETLLSKADSKLLLPRQQEIDCLPIQTFSNLNLQLGLQPVT